MVQPMDIWEGIARSAEQEAADDIDAKIGVQLRQVAAIAAQRRLAQ